jgi:hypothetical protein
VRNLIARAAIVAVAASLGLMIAGSAADAASSPQWQVSYRNHSATGAQLWSVTAPSRTDAWAVGIAHSTSPYVLHWNGSSWHKQAMPAGFLPSVVLSSSPDDVWIFGSPSQDAMVWNGSLWRATALPSGFTPGAVLSSSDVWGTAGGACTPVNDAICTTTVWHWNGSAWSSSEVKGLYQGFTGAGGHAWLLTETHLRNYLSDDPTGLPVVYRATGGTLQRVTSPARRVWDFAQIAAAPNGRLWIEANPGNNKNADLLFYWNRRAWTDARIPAQVGSNPALPLSAAGPLTYDGRNGVWAGPYAHWTGTKWINAFQVLDMPLADGFGIIAIAAIPGSASIWGVGSVYRTPTSHTLDPLIAVYGGTP